MARTQQEDKYLALVAECDVLIKAGRINQVSKLISDLVIAQVPRIARQGLAKCCRRIGLIGIGLRLLHPVIRSQKILDEPVSAQEICEYSALLARNGSVFEALELLKSVDTTLAPEAFLYLGQCHILNWEYAEAVHYFEKFLSSNGDEYSKLVARVNLISGLIVLFKFDEAAVILSETIALAEKSGAARLKANCLELWGQVHFWRKDFPEARKMLSAAAAIFSNVQSTDQFLILKTEAIMNALETKSAEPLARFRNLAVERRNWEGIREADLFLQQISPSQNSLDHLIFGTPKTAYRRRIEMLVGSHPSEKYVLGQTTGPQLQLRTGKVIGGSSPPLGKKIHQVISTLNKDFYAPVNVGTLFYELYPDEYFNVDSSPFRIRQAILRTRQWLEQNDIPASIEQSQGSYRFSIHGNFGVTLELDSQAVNPTMVRWQLLKDRLAPGKSFTSEEICQEMNWSRTTFRRLADWACENALLVRSGVGKATTYQLNPQLEIRQGKQTAS